ncbi:SwmB domain-containing protein, partial [Acinetobacter sp. ULE_I010]|uniref:SwmB domain-containing protein n=1 Tax=Acinetobacter sp. ULE_I010 TaxID=3373065 RepID=UPI003AF89E3F
MTNITVYEKGTAKTITSDMVDTHHAVYKADLDRADIKQITKVNNNLEIELQNGEKVTIENFFVGQKPKEFVIESADGKYFLVNMLEFDANGVATKVDYLGIADFQDYLVDGQSSVVPVWAWVAGAAGLIGIAGAAAGGGGSDHSDNGDKTGPKITHDILDNNKIKITANEASQIIISDSTGKIIGTGQLNQAGHIDITLTRPLQDNETITVTATDNSGNKTIETFNVGDVTAPIISAEIQDAMHVDIISNESGTVKITDSKGNVIGDGTLTGNGTVENIQLDRPLIDGETITVTVTDPSGNPKELEVTVGDVTTPKFINAEVNAAGELVLHYSEGLDATKPPSADQFTVTVGGTIIDPSNIIVTVSGTDVTLSFVPPIYKDQDVSIAYKDKTTSDDDVAIQDAAGNDAADLVTTPVDNNGSTVIDPNGDTTAPSFVNAEVNAAGELVLHYSEGLDATKPPSADQFTVT